MKGIANTSEGHSLSNEIRFISSHVWVHLPQIVRDCSPEGSAVIEGTCIGRLILCRVCDVLVQANKRFLQMVRALAFWLFLFPYTLNQLPNIIPVN